ncbi:hypothetical protein FQN54_002028 [Arachnomyces sp. PD_36]|nr:hypothetical protein FQN54_002028 [Arachnomyces sp. PD_36]
MSDIEDDVPFWAVSDTLISQESCYLTTRCNGKRFYIIAEAPDFEDEIGDLKKEFLEMVEAESVDELEIWMAEPFLPIMKALAPTAPLSLTLEQFYNAETFTFKLVSNDGKLSPVPLPDDTDPNAYISPKISAHRLPTGHNIKSIDASAVSAAPIDDNERYFGADAPTKVSVDGKQYHFKPVQIRHSFIREFRILSKLVETGLNERCRVPTISFLVHYTDDEGSIIGFLLEPIKSKRTIYLYEFEDIQPQQRQKWVAQIEELVRQLHDNDIVRGDVEPDRVLIDEEDNVWLLDFGHGYNSVTETVEVDAQGVSRITKYLDDPEKWTTSSGDSDEDSDSQ